MLGTAAYMSPEQVPRPGRRQNAATFGRSRCVLVGMPDRCRTLFGGEDGRPIRSERFCKTEPDWKQLPPETPPTRCGTCCDAASPRIRASGCTTSPTRGSSWKDEDPFTPAATGSPRLATASPSPCWRWPCVAEPDRRRCCAFLRQDEIDGSASGGDNPARRGDRSQQGHRLSRAVRVRTLQSRPDGRFVAFVSDRDGPFDVFVGQIGSG